MNDRTQGFLSSKLENPVDELGTALTHCRHSISLTGIGFMPGCGLTSSVAGQELCLHWFSVFHVLLDKHEFISICLLPYFPGL